MVAGLDTSPQRRLAEACSKQAGTGNIKYQFILWVFLIKYQQPREGRRVGSSKKMLSISLLTPAKSLMDNLQPAGVRNNTSYSI